jgi:hypothetical protein
MHIVAEQNQRDKFSPTNCRYDIHIIEISFYEFIFSYRNLLLCQGLERALWVKNSKEMTILENVEI